VLAPPRPEANAPPPVLAPPRPEPAEPSGSDGN
jgi:hypothetical protein